ncbi:MAG: Thioesterase-like superfamily, partial [Bacteroidota bacterium]
MEDYQATVDVQLRFRDTDALGHVNNAVYLSWMELG